MQLLPTFKRHLHSWLWLPDDLDTKCPWQHTRAMALLMNLCLLSVAGWVAVRVHHSSYFLVPPQSLVHGMLSDSRLVRLLLCRSGTGDEHLKAWAAKTDSHTGHPQKVTPGSACGDRKIKCWSKKKNNLKIYGNTEAVEQTWGFYWSLLFFSYGTVFEGKVRDVFFLLSFLLSVVHIFTWYFLWGMHAFQQLIENSDNEDCSFW